VPSSSTLASELTLNSVSRILYRKCKILHRDISPGNVLVDNKPTVSIGHLRDDLGDMCFSEYLLNTPAGQDNSEYVKRIVDARVD
jgi:Fungal protein kinase